MGKIVRLRAQAAHVNIGLIQSKIEEIERPAVAREQNQGSRVIVWCSKM